jgi:alpha-glucosidase
MMPGHSQERRVSEPWWRGAVIYQIYPRSFQDSDGDGVGDLRGVIQRLDYLADLGVDALWLSPIFPSPGKDFGYDVSDYRGVDPIFGTLADFDELLAQAHARGLRVILDQVLNHTSDQHPWFLESRGSRDGAKADWYVWVDGQPDRPPNNWLSYFGGSAWQWDETRRQHYLHLFLREQPDLNWRNPDVRRALHEVLCFWLERGVDGFRLDVVNLYFKDELLRDNPRRRDASSPIPFRNFHRLYNHDRPETLLAVEELRRLVDRYDDRVTIGEVSSPQGVAQYFEYTKPGRLDLAFNFEFKSTPAYSARGFFAQVQRCEATYGELAWPSYVLGNHDTPRFVSRFGDGEHDAGRARVLAALLLTLRGTPFIYYGEELGMAEASIPYDRIVDPEGRHLWPHHSGRDGCRTPMQWDSTRGAGFSTHEPWLPVSEGSVNVNVARQLEDEGSMLCFYRRLLRLRRSTPALQLGDLRWLVPDDTGRWPAGAEDLLGYWRERDGARALVLLNLGEQPASLGGVELPADGQVVFGSHRERLEGLTELDPFEVLIIDADGETR